MFIKNQAAQGLKFQSSRVADKSPSQAKPQAPTADGSFGQDVVDFGRNMAYGSTGAIPLLGAGVNALATWPLAEGKDNKMAAATAAGALANLAGTVTLATGLLTGSSGATTAGLGLLALSGATSTAAVFKLN